MPNRYCNLAESFYEGGQTLRVNGKTDESRPREAKMLGLDRTNGDIVTSTVSDEELEAACGSPLVMMVPTFVGVTYCFGCPPSATEFTEPKAVLDAAPFTLLLGNDGHDTDIT